MIRGALLTACLMTLAAAGFAQTKHAGDCGELVTIPTHDKTTMRYALSRPASAQGESIAVVLLPGGGGPHSSKHAEDLGRVIEDVRARTRGPVWVIGTSRGTISAANVASRPPGPTAPDGVVLTSALTVGSRSNQRPWLSQTVFDLPLEKIRVPVLIVGHAADTCLRSPAAMMTRIADGTNGVRKQVVTVTGGPGMPAGTQSSVDACVGRSRHGFVDRRRRSPPALPASSGAEASSEARIDDRRRCVTSGRSP